MGQHVECCSSPCGDPPTGDQGKINIWGDYFNQDTRALLIICDMAEADYHFRLIDTFNKKNFDPTYIEINPNSSIPIIT